MKSVEELMAIVEEMAKKAYKDDKWMVMDNFNPEQLEEWESTEHFSQNYGYPIEQLVNDHKDADLYFFLIGHFWETLEKQYEDISCG